MKDQDNNSQRIIIASALALAAALAGCTKDHDHGPSAEPGHSHEGGEGAGHDETVKADGHAGGHGHGTEAGGGHADGHAHAHGDGHATEIPETADGIWKAIHAKHAELAQVVASKELAKVHEVAFAIRDLAKGLVDKAPAAKRAQVEGAVNNVSRLAGLLDETGDAGEQAETEANLKKLDGVLKILAAATGAHDALAAYPHKTCPVSGEALGSMGEPVVLQHEGRTVKLCCKSCIKKFNADPAKYLAVLDAAAEAKHQH